jgi:hypothetical protein
LGVRQYFMPINLETATLDEFELKKETWFTSWWTTNR